MISEKTLSAAHPRRFLATYLKQRSIPFPSISFPHPIQPLSTRSPMPIHRCLRLVILLLTFFFSSTSAYDLSVDSHPSRLRLPPGRPVEGSPGSRPGSVMTCNRIHIHGVSRLRHPSKYAHSLKIRLSVAQVDALFRIQTIELCFHQNASIGLGMCPPGEWLKLSKNSWVQSMSPYGYKILDVRMLPDPSRTIELSSEEEFMFHRIVFLVLGLIMMMMARFLSESVVFYYGGAMTLGIVVVILMVLFQGMRLLPTGRKSSLAIFMYSSVVGIGTFLLHYLSGLLRTILVEIGISEDMHNPVSGYTSFGMPHPSWSLVWLLGCPQTCADRRWIG